MSCIKILKNVLIGPVFMYSIDSLLCAASVVFCFTYGYLLIPQNKIQIFRHKQWNEIDDLYYMVFRKRPF